MPDTRLPDEVGGGVSLYGDPAAPEQAVCGEKLGFFFRLANDPDPPSWTQQSARIALGSRILALVRVWMTQGVAE